MPQLNRRTFLRASAGVGALGLLSGAAAVSWPELMDAAQRRPRAQGDGVAVIVTLYGGNDGINTLIPYADNAYHDARPDLAYAPGDVLHLDDQSGLNPALKGLHTAWGDGHLAIVRGVSYPKPDHSHFRSMDIWQTASPDEPVSTGWIGRWLDSTGDDPLRAVNVGAVLPPMACGRQDDRRCPVDDHLGGIRKPVRLHPRGAERPRRPRHRCHVRRVEVLPHHPSRRHGLRRPRSLRRSRSQPVGPLNSSWSPRRSPLRPPVASTWSRWGVSTPTPTNAALNNDCCRPSTRPSPHS